MHVCRLDCETRPKEHSMLLNLEHLAGRSTNAKLGVELHLADPEIHQGLALDEVARLAEVIVDLLVRLDTERVVDRRQQIVGMYRLLLW